MSSTNDLKTERFKCLLYGRTGIGKTTLLGTAPKPFIIATEDGLQPLSDLKIDYQRITATVMLKQLWLDLQKSGYETICIDSLTALSDMILVEVEKETGSEEAMTTYPLVRTKLLKIINGYLKLPKHIIMTATETRSDTNKPVLPSVIGGKLCEDLARLFDHVQFMDFGGKEDSVVIHRTRHRYSVAKDRTRQLGSGEPAKYTAGYFDDVIATINGTIDTNPPPPPAEETDTNKGGDINKGGGDTIPFEFDL